MLSSILKDAINYADDYNEKIKQLRFLLAEDFEKAEEFSETFVLSGENMLKQTAEKLVRELVEKCDCERLSKLSPILLANYILVGLESEFAAIRKLFYTKLFDYTLLERRGNDGYFVGFSGGWTVVYNSVGQEKILENILRKELLEVLLEMIKKFPQIEKILEESRVKATYSDIYYCCANRDVRVVKYLEHNKLLNWTNVPVKFAHKISPQVFAYLLKNEEFVKTRINAFFREWFKFRLDEEFFFSIFLYAGDFCGSFFTAGPIAEFLQRVRTYYLDFLLLFDNLLFPRELITPVVGYYC